ncbi:GntR family transcriptional regulator [Bordetella genomosp. 12]|uniref:GntR family transcriptional regulator n=1 Tax=Bordetella genomosp. 12 TaxID=463035 RepID=A0A261VMW4_9BORD|nr:GntR family transcriptional regulator [Bordetella genomosp. 12]OZI75197.1 GntR family transcriptional regulator [Bordetella genomosp. 12]
MTLLAEPAAFTADSARDALEEDIVLGRLHPRQRLTEDELMARFGLKRHAVRNVLANLELMGAVQRKRNIGAEVRAFQAAEVVELYALRELLETRAAAQIPLPVPAQSLQELIGIQREHDAAVSLGDARAVFRSNQRFHRALFALTRNPVLEQAIEEYARRTHPIRFGTLAQASYRERARQEHWAMIEALREGNRAALTDICARHLIPSRDAYLAAERARHGVAPEPA